MSIALLRQWLGPGAPSPHDTELRRLVRDALFEHDALLSSIRAQLNSRLSRKVFVVPEQTPPTPEELADTEALATQQMRDAEARHAGELHTPHCWARLGWGDGECECADADAALKVRGGWRSGVESEAP